MIRCEKPPRLHRLILCPARPTSTPFSSTPRIQTPPPSLHPSPPLSGTLLSKSISRSLHYRSLGHRLLHLWGENVCILCLCVVSAVGERGEEGLLGRPRDLVHGQVPEAVCISKRVSPPPRCRISRLPLLPTAHSPRISPLCFRKTQKVKNTLEGCL